MTRALRTRILLGTAAAGALTLLPTTAYAQTVTFDSGNTGVQPTQSTRGSEVAAAASTPTRPASTQRLPLTGTDVAGLVVLGGAAIGLGAVALGTSKRRTSAG